MKSSHLNSHSGDVARLGLVVRGRIDAPTAGFFLPDHDPPLRHSPVSAPPLIPALPCLTLLD